MATKTLATIPRRMFLTRAPLFTAGAAGAVALPRLASAKCWDCDLPDPNILWDVNDSIIQLENNIQSLINAGWQTFGPGEWQNLGDWLSQLGGQWALNGNCFRLDAFIAKRVNWDCMRTSPSSAAALNYVTQNGTAAAIGQIARDIQSLTNTKACAIFWALNSAMWGLIAVAMTLANIVFPPSAAADTEVLLLIAGLLDVINGLGGLTC